jgi:undecaprenyl diphosphate synthase
MKEEFAGKDEFAGLIQPGSAEESLLAQIDPARLPRHIAVIMDGNGRWAKRRLLPRIAGHRAGVEAVRVAVDGCARLGIQALTLYAFSVENWKRPAIEVEALMTFLKEYLRKEIDDLHRNRIQFKAIGRLGELDQSVQVELEAAIAKTTGNDGMILNLALNYGGRVELVDAFRHLLRECLEEGRSPDSITEQDITRSLYTAEQPDPDLLIRTSGELRISNFLLWQIAYAEIYVTDTLWPDFRLAHLFKAIIEYQKRDRRFGGLTPSQLAVVSAN